MQSSFSIYKIEAIINYYDNVFGVTLKKHCAFVILYTALLIYCCFFVLQ